ncbi:hypothetical protein FNH22_12785 [Fulvivirga sp. M361]|uniref:hypothetical protein n=1 Tax=Fulvivirga sp. M361 TaxID=2594266 RepID=UPI00117ACFBB|nr:hypothetical protein [Fulvivirga sp. M361]TRX58746.1 hypothetical protein FNH22_12785 [Fulvivirga sp. M361]
MKSLFGHLEPDELVAMLAGICFFWVIVWSIDKDEYDESNRKFSNKSWFKDWFLKKYDNIITHILTSLFFLYIGVENLQSYLGDFAETLPAAANKVGSASLIGFAGSYMSDVLKKGLKLTRK